MTTYAIAILCVLGLAIGQILFKASATNLLQSGSFFDFKTAAILLAAICLYGSVYCATVLEPTALSTTPPKNARGAEVARMVKVTGTLMVLTAFELSATDPV